MYTSIIIVAAGKGERFGQPKWSVELAGKSLLEWNLDTLQNLSFEHDVVLVAANDDIDRVRKIVSKYDSDIRVVAGGEARIDSVMAGLAICQDAELVIIHNVANPLAGKEDFESIYHELLQTDCACFVGQEVVDTLRVIDERGSETLDRENTWRVQTPQGFRKASLMAVLDSSERAQLTDEVMLFDRSSTPVRAIRTSVKNQKITYPEDLVLFKSFL